MERGPKRKGTQLIKPLKSKLQKQAEIEKAMKSFSQEITKLPCGPKPVTQWTRTNHGNEMHGFLRPSSVLHKPNEPKKKKKRRESPERMRKWEHANEVVKFFAEKNISAHVFEASSTPHIRVLLIDYWPATQRFYDLQTGRKGKGFDQFAKLALSKHEEAFELSDDWLTDFSRSMEDLVVRDGDKR